MTNKINKRIKPVLAMMQIYANLLGIKITKNYTRLDNPKFVDFLTRENKRTDIGRITQIENSNFYPQSLYEVFLDSKERIVYKMDKNGNTKQISGPEYNASPKDYITQKLTAIQALKNYIDAQN